MTSPAALVATCALGQGDEDMLWKILRERIGKGLVVADGRPLTVDVQQKFKVSRSQPMQDRYPVPQCVLVLCETGREADRWPVPPRFRRLKTYPWLILFVRGT